MKQDLDPKVIGLSIGGIVLVLIAVYLFLGRQQGDRSGPTFEVNFHGPNAMHPPGKAMGLPGGVGEGTMSGRMGAPKPPVPASQ